MEPLELLARLAALVPPPRTPLIRFHGAIAPNFPQRNAVVALAPKAGIERNAQSCSPTPGKREAESEGHGVQPVERCRPAPDEATKSDVEPGATAVIACSPRAPSLTVALNQPVSRGAPDCDPFRTFESAISRIDWATLLRRVYDIDALACPCGGRLRFTDLVTDPDEARTVLKGLNLPASPPPVLPPHAAPELLDLPAPDP